MAAKKRTAGATGESPSAELLGLPERVAEDIGGAVLAGFGYSTVESLQCALGLSLEALAELVLIRPRTLARRKVEGRLSPEESDRVLRAARLFALVVALFEGDLDAARRWMAQPNRALAGRTPLEVGRTDVGVREVEALIGRLEHGVLD